MLEKILLADNTCKKVKLMHSELTLNNVTHNGGSVSFAITPNNHMLRGFLHNNLATHHAAPHVRIHLWDLALISAVESLWSSLSPKYPETSVVANYALPVAPFTLYNRTTLPSMHIVCKCRTAALASFTTRPTQLCTFANNDTVRDRRNRCALAINVPSL